MRILVDNADGKLSLGQAVSAAVVVREKKSWPCRSRPFMTSARERSSTSFATVEIAVLKDPKLGLKDEQWVEVGSTELEADDQVVVEGGYNLPEGTEVAVEKMEESRPDKAEKEGAVKKKLAEEAPAANPHPPPLSQRERGAGEKAAESDP